MYYSYKISVFDFSTWVAKKHIMVYYIERFNFPLTYFSKKEFSSIRLDDVETFEA
jgi:hypothetical protein